MKERKGTGAAPAGKGWEKLLGEAEALLDGEEDFIAAAANLSALLYHGLEAVNWAGVYRLRGGELVLGPFQGRPACRRIPLGKGVCGTAAREGKSLVVPDVHAFPGHIACDAASRSEIVVPVKRKGRVLGVLDLDSPVRGRFGETDREALEHLAELLARASGDGGA